MKIWIIALVVGLLAIASLVVADTLQEDEEIVSEPAYSAAPTCGGGCSAGNTCGNPTCGAKVGESCGCGR